MKCVLDLQLAFFNLLAAVSVMDCGEYERGRRSPRYERDCGGEKENIGNIKNFLRVEVQSFNRAYYFLFRIKLLIIFLSIPPII